MKKNVNTLFILVTTVFAFLVSGCGQSPKIPKSHQAQLNPQPKHFMIITGRVDPKLPKKYKLQFVASYQTNNPKCNITINWLEGVDAPLHFDKRFYPILQTNGDYRLDIPLDQYMPGQCLWNISAISYAVESSVSVENMTIMAFFGNAIKQQGKTINSFQIERCNLKYCQTDKLYGFTTQSKDISPYHNYYYNFNLEEKK